MHMPLNQSVYHLLPLRSVVINPCVKQNYRKYFESRKQH